MTPILPSTGKLLSALTMHTATRRDSPFTVRLRTYAKHMPARIMVHWGCSWLCDYAKKGWSGVTVTQVDKFIFQVDLNKFVFKSAMPSILYFFTKVEVV